jgi:hypothetical protein
MSAIPPLLGEKQTFGERAKNDAMNIDRTIGPGDILCRALLSTLVPSRLYWEVDLSSASGSKAEKANWLKSS